MIITLDNKNYKRVEFDSESEIEKVVFDNSELLFGSYSMVLPKQKINTLGGYGTIPDGIVINFESNEWYLVEVEKSSHGTWEHIAPQVSKQLTSLSNSDNLDKILNLALNNIKNNKELKDNLKELEIDEISVHGKIGSILKKRPLIAIPIDYTPKDLLEWANTLKNEVMIWEIKKYTSDTGELLYSIPDDFEPTIETSPKSPRVFQSRINFRDLVKNGIIKTGDELYIEYGPRGMPKNKYMGIAREDGIEIDGKIYSPSYAAVECMQKAGSTQQTANGWVMWRNSEGVLINDLAKKLENK